ncbi:MAG: hypothetical protein Q9208_008029 [Pyrenodesmia sp. 3 TL-2023]
MADESPERVLGDITNRQRSQNPSPRRPQARRLQGSLPVDENTPFPTAAPRTVTQIQGEPLHFAGSSAISSPVASSSPSAAAAPTSPQPMIDLRLRVPADYLPLEPVCDSQVPLHFTWTEVRGISDSEDPFCERVDAMTTEIRDEFREREYLLWWGVVFCQVEKPHVLIREEEELARSQNREFEEVYPPRLLAVQATPTLMHRH